MAFYRKGAPISVLTAYGYLSFHSMEFVKEWLRVFKLVRLYNAFDNFFVLSAA